MTGRWGDLTLVVLNVFNFFASGRVILKIFKLIIEKITWALLSLWDCYQVKATLSHDLRSQYWVRQWLGTVRQQAITWANVDPDMCHHMAWLGHNGLKKHGNKFALPVIYLHGAGIWNLCVWKTRIRFILLYVVKQEPQHQQPRYWPSFAVVVLFPAPEGLIYKHIEAEAKWPLFHRRHFQMHFF